MPRAIPASPSAAGSSARSHWKPASPTGPRICCCSRRRPSTCWRSASGSMRAERPAYFEADRWWRVRRRGGEYEDAYFTICYSPIPDASVAQGIGGILVSCVETTERVRTEQALRRLNDTLEAEVAQRTL